MLIYNRGCGRYVNIRAVGKGFRLNALPHGLRPAASMHPHARKIGAEDTTHGRLGVLLQRLTATLAAVELGGELGGSCGSTIFCCPHQRFGLQQFLLFGSRLAL